ncbi:AAA family ATPase, partial [Kaistella sp.]|uniref:AAA family ATPase n=1 Tax=Kaistella sp. TaxID=2782235 RepID=UPI002F947738
KVEGQIAKLKNKEEKMKGFSIEFDYKSEDLLQVITALSNAISSLPMSDEIDYYNTIDTSNYPPDDLDPNYSPEYEYEKNDVFHYDSDQSNWLVRLEMEIEQHEEFQILYYQKNEVIKFLSGIKDFIENSEIAYLPATLQKQSSLFSIKDKGNVLAQVLHFYFQNYYLYISHSDAEQDNFIEKWMTEFEIGDKYSIYQVEGEAYKMEIEKNNVWISLADKGMGAIQAMLLILRIGSIIRQQKSGEKKFIVILEEPELNLHPALQSKLCDMFYDVYEKWGIEFIIETHSEYMIRRSQVITAQQEFSSDMEAVNPNPFTALYFPSEEKAQAYSMNYQPDGTFENSFGSGFFDASSSSTLELIKLKRQKDKK